MIANLIGGFVAILVGVSLIGPISQQVNIAAGPCDPTSTLSYYNITSGLCTNGTSGVPNTATTALYQSSTWAPTILNLVPGFFSFGILGVGIALTYSSLRQAGVV